MTVLIMAGGRASLPENNFDHVIGVDHGALFLVENGWQLNLAVGDFDSVSSDELVKIQQASDSLVKLPPEKDDTDLEVALKFAVREFPEDKICIMGALGGRLDHLLTNLYLPTREEFQQFAARISFVDAQNLVNYLPAGQHELAAVAGKKYIGFVQVKTKNFRIENAKYPLAPEKNEKQIYASNEFVQGKMRVEIAAGMLIVIYSSD